MSYLLFPLDLFITNEDGKFQEEMHFAQLF